MLHINRQKHISLNNNFKKRYEGRYIKISAKSKDNNLQITISSLYLEPGGEIFIIQEELFDSNIIARVLNQAETGLNKDGVYHCKSIENLQTIKINDKISEHDKKIRQDNNTFKIMKDFPK